MSKARQKQRAVARRAAGLKVWDWRAYLNTRPGIRKRIECAMPGEQLLAVVHFMRKREKATPEQIAFCEAVLHDLEKAAGEAFDGLPRPVADEACRAMGLACDYAWWGDPGTAGPPKTPDVLIITTMLWLTHIERSGFLLPTPDSAFASARKVIEGELETAKNSPSFLADYQRAYGYALELVPAMQIRFEEVGLFVGALDSLIAEAA